MVLFYDFEKWGRNYLLVGAGEVGCFKGRVSNVYLGCLGDVNMLLIVLFWDFF